MAEFPVCEDSRDSGQFVKNRITQVIPDDWRNIARALGLRPAGSVG